MSNFFETVVMPGIFFLLLVALTICFLALGVCLYQGYKDSQLCHKQTGFYECKLATNNQLKVEIK